MKPHEAKMALGQQRTPTEWGQIFTSFIPDAELVFRMYKEQQQKNRYQESKHSN